MTDTKHPREELHFFVQEIAGGKWYTLLGCATKRAAFECAASLAKAKLDKDGYYLRGAMGRQYRVVDANTCMMNGAD